jgi:hypothetical protein
VTRHSGPLARACVPYYQHTGNDGFQTSSHPRPSLAEGRLAMSWCVATAAYRPNTSTTNEPGTMLGHGCGRSGVGGGGGPNFAVAR